MAWLLSLPMRLSRWWITRYGSSLDRWAFNAYNEGRPYFKRIE
jgi:hypothetical protein